VALISDLSQESWQGVAADSSVSAGGRPGTVGFEVVVSRQAGSVVVCPHGDLDAVTSPKFALVLASLLGDGCRSVVVDLAELGFLDAAGAWLIGEASRLFKDHGGQLVVRSPRALLRPVDGSAGFGPPVEIQREGADIAPRSC
jgi:anti-anti-sigma factor